MCLKDTPNTIHLQRMRHIRLCSRVGTCQKFDFLLQIADFSVIVRKYFR